VHVPGAGVHIGLLACTWVAQAYRRDIPGFQTDVHACSLMPTKSIQHCRRAAAIEDQQGTVAYEQLPLQAEETSLLSCKRECQREEVIFSINTARSYILHLRSVRPSSLGLSTSEEKPRLGVGLDRLARYQNCNFSANWICREVVEVAVMTPPNGLYSAPWKTTSFGYERFG